MNKSNECPQCGGTANHAITDTRGESYYHCTRGLTAFSNKVRDDITGRYEPLSSRDSRIVSCDTLIHRGRVFNGAIAYAVDGDVKAIMVTNGRMK